MTMHAPVSPLRRLPDMSRPLVIVGHSAEMQRIEREISAAAASNVTVLIAGESGVGRRLIARTIHDRSVRHAGPFVSVNCVCLPDARLETELFGHSGTGMNSVNVSRGRLEAADGGSIVLQDVGYVSWRLQGRLLRYIETSSKVRLMAITHRRLVHAMNNLAFREGVFYGTNVIHIEVAPLRERSEDVPSLCHYFMSVQAARLGRPVVELAPDALNCLAEYDWPGNVRELRDIAERLVETNTSDRIGVDALPQALVRRSMSRTMARWG